MGAIYADVTISNPADRSRRWNGRFLIDSGAIDTVVPSKHLRDIGIPVDETRRYSMADGRVSQSWKWGSRESSSWAVRQASPSCLPTTRCGRCSVRRRWSRWELKSIWLGRGRGGLPSVQL